ncbi:hypothetical protein DIPPA_17633 [Diplonema papillatum]|nr:hypothetical protein DIPPA_17633 [Diplonema papillatum]
MLKRLWGAPGYLYSGTRVVSSVASMTYPQYHIGTPGTPWGDEEKAQWRKEQPKKRDYATDVLDRLARLPKDSLEVFTYGSVDYSGLGLPKYELRAVRTAAWDEKKPLIAVTGGVHGYETSGVHGALKFVEEEMVSLAARGVNVLVLPCISPWGYETINRWTPNAVDPNRTFFPDGPLSDEAKAAMPAIAAWAAKSAQLLMHADLHETTDRDNSEFRPAKVARDGAPAEQWDPIPDGFYLVTCEETQQPAFNKAIVDAVEAVTHIAEPDDRGMIIGIKITQRGVVAIPKGVGVCGAHSTATFATTTEVYPDSSRTTPEICNAAQVAVVVTGAAHALSTLQ